MKAICCLFVLLVLHITETGSQPECSTGPFCDRKSLADAINEFSFNLIKYLGNENSNLFISPFSIAVALAMTFLGAGGDTAKQMKEVLQYSSHNLSDSEVHDRFRSLIATLAEKNDEYSLLVANGMFMKESTDGQENTVKQSYIDDLIKFYSVVLEYLDFAKDGGQAAIKRINEWVAEKTQNKIEKLFEEPLDQNTVLVLLNAVYFKGTWKVQFPENQTTDGDFYKSDRTTVKAKLMSIRKEKFRFLEDDTTKHKFVELPYKGNNIAMLVVLPRERDQPLDINMSTELLRRVNNSMAVTQLDVMTLPKFKTEYKAELNDPLTKMGMADLFVGGRANLTGIRPQNDLFVDKILHKAVIEVNEQGSEAAAVTGVVGGTLSVKPTFVADHPFLYYIIDKRNGLILFSGRVTDPTQ